MSKQTMVMVLSEHSEIAWDHKAGKAFCDGCDVVLCDLGETMDHQHWRLWEHLADMMLDAGLGLTRVAEADAWEEGMCAGYDYYPALARSGFNDARPDNPYTD